jgi:hypothetical protein
MALNTAAIRALLEPGLYAVEGDYESKPAQWNKIFKTRKSTKQVEQKAQMRFLGLPALKAEGGSIYISTTRAVSVQFGTHVLLKLPSDLP